MTTTRQLAQIAGTILKTEKDDTKRRVALEMLGPQPAAPLDPLLIVEEPTYEGLVKLFFTRTTQHGLV